MALLAASEPEVPFEPGAERFGDAPACRTHLGRLVTEARGQDYAAVEGPYDIAAGDVRIHMVRQEDGGHRITEHRCLAAGLSSRTWLHRMAQEAEEPFTIESVARKAEWLKKGTGEKQ